MTIAPNLTFKAHLHSAHSGVWSGCEKKMNTADLLTTLKGHIEALPDSSQKTEIENVMAQLLLLSLNDAVKVVLEGQCQAKTGKGTRCTLKRDLLLAGDGTHTVCRKYHANRTKPDQFYTEN